MIYDMRDIFYNWRREREYLAGVKSPQQSYFDNLMRGSAAGYEIEDAAKVFAAKDDPLADFTTQELNEELAKRKAAKRGNHNGEETTAR